MAGPRALGSLGWGIDCLARVRIQAHTHTYVCVCVSIHVCRMNIHNVSTEGLDRLYNVYILWATTPDGNPERLLGPDSCCLSRIERRSPNFSYGLFGAFATGTCYRIITAGLAAHAIWKSTLLSFLSSGVQACGSAHTNTSFFPSFDYLPKFYFHFKHPLIYLPT